MTPSFLPEADDEVAHGLRAGRSVGGELVGLEVALVGLGLEVVLDEFLRGQVSGRAIESLWRDIEELLGEGVDGLAGGLLGAGLWTEESKDEQQQKRKADLCEKGSSDSGGTSVVGILRLRASRSAQDDSFVMCAHGAQDDCFSEERWTCHAAGFSLRLRWSGWTK